jgi:hypothetical protein
MIREWSPARCVKGLDAKLGDRISYGTQVVEKFARPQRDTEVIERFAKKAVLVDPKWVDHVERADEGRLTPDNLLPPEAQGKRMTKDLAEVGVEIDLAEFILRENKLLRLVFVVESLVFFADEIDRVKAPTINEREVCSLEQRDVEPAQELTIFDEFFEYVLQA